MESSVWVNQEIKEFFNGIEKIQENFAGLISNPEIYSRFDMSNWDRETPVITAVKPVIDMSQAREMTSTLLDYLIRFKPKWKNDLELIKNLSEEEFAGLLTFYFEKNETGIRNIIDRHKITPAVAYFMLTHIGKPYLRIFSDYFKKYIDVENWLKGICPVCGNHSVMARIDKNGGRRYLYCRDCDTEWLFKLLKCPWCGNEDHETLSFINIEETPGYGLHVCEKCKRYVKVIDERKGGNSGLLADELETLFLDVVARQQGYNSTL